MDADLTVVVVGAGLAGAKAAETLREEGFRGRVILVGDEREYPYERPPLSKGYLTGSDEKDSAFVHESGWYAAHDVELHLGQPATALDRAAKEITLGDGTRMHYDKLVLAPGSSPRRLDIPGADLGGVYTLRRFPEAERLRGALKSLGQINGQLLVIGAGWIGLEVTAAARGYGVEVTVVEPNPSPLHAVLGPELGGFFADLHREHGVRFHFGTAVTELHGQDGMVISASTDGGEELPAHAVMMAVGAAPEVALAADAGLDLAPREDGGGVRVDGALRTSDPDIHAVGDIACVPYPALGGRRLRVEHWGNALAGGPAAARALLSADAPAYDEVPYFFSDQYDLGMEYAGFAAPGEYDQVLVRGNAAKREFIAFWLADGRVKAGMNVNVWDVNDTIQKIIRAGAVVDTERLANPEVPLEEFAG